MQQIKRKYHQHEAEISDIIIAISKKVKEVHDIILSIDVNELFTNVAGGIEKLWFDNKSSVYSTISKDAHLIQNHTCKDPQKLINYRQ